MNKHKKKLANHIEKDVTQMFESALDYAQVACPDPHTYQTLRSRILRAGNNCKRSLVVCLDDYDITFIPKTEEIIEIKN